SRTIRFPLRCPTLHRLFLWRDTQVTRRILATHRRCGWAAVERNRPERRCADQGWGIRAVRAGQRRAGGRHLLRELHRLVCEFLLRQGKPARYALGIELSDAAAFTR